MKVDPSPGVLSALIGFQDIVSFRREEDPQILAVDRAIVNDQNFHRAAVCEFLGAREADPFGSRPRHLPPYLTFDDPV